MEQVNDSFNEMMTPEIVFEMKPQGAERMRNLTTKYEGRQLGVVMNDRLHSAPNINEPIGKNGSINFGRCLSEDDCQRIQKEIDLLLDKLQAAGVKIGKEPRGLLSFFPSSAFLALAAPAFAVLCVLVGSLVGLFGSAARRRSSNAAVAPANVNASNNSADANNSANISDLADFNNSAKLTDSAKNND